MAEAEPTPPYSDEQLKGDDVSKKDLVAFLQANASLQFQKEHKLKGTLKNITKSSTKDHLIASYKELFEKKAFKKEGEEEEAAAASAAAAAEKSVEQVVEKTETLEVKDVDEGPPKYSKRVVKKGDKVNYPKKGDTVSCFYKGTLDDGTVFDTNTVAAKRGKKPQALKFKVGVGKVIRGWDEGIQTMSVGEKADLIIEPEWAYEKKGIPGKVPPNSRLTFEVELLSID